MNTLGHDTTVSTIALGMFPHLSTHRQINSDAEPRDAALDPRLDRADRLISVIKVDFDIIINLSVYSRRGCTGKDGMSVRN